MPGITILGVIMKLLLSTILLCLLPLSAIGQSLLLENLRGYTANSERQWQSFDWLLIQHGRVSAVGFDGAEAPPADQRRDMQGKVVLPGLIDAHAHIANLGLSMLNADLRDLDSLAASVERVAEFAAEHPDLPWIEGRAWNQVLWQDHNDFPTAADLDAVVDDRPVWLVRVDGHAGWANSMALELAGIDADTADPDGGEIIRDDDGQPTGVLIDTAMYKVSRLIPEPDHDTLREAMLNAMNHAASVGLTSVHDAGVNVAEDRVYRQLRAENALPIRIWGLIGGVGEDFDTLAQHGPLRDPWYSLASVKLYNDGALGSRGAALHEPYSDAADTRGLLFNTVEQLTPLLEKAISRGFQVGVHAIGDRANTVVLDSFAGVLGDDSGRRALRHRIEHAQVLRVDEIPRLAELDLIASMQPIHATSDKNMAEDRLGSERIHGAYAWQRFLEAEVVIASGSDFPVEPAEPFYGLHAAVTRQDRQHQPPGGWYSNQALTMEQALNSFTIDAAFAGHAENQLGRLLPGYRADFIVLEENPLEIEANELWQLLPLQTWVDGQQVFSK